MTKTALITGSSNGIGAAIAQTLAEAGYQVFLTGRNLERLQAQATKIKALGYLAGDLLDDGFVEELIKHANENLGKVDVLVNNAGAYHWAAIEDTDPQKTTELLKLNLGVPIKLCSLLVSAMKRNGWGRIINIGSISGVVGEPNAALYAASKAGLIGLTKSLALELAEYGITVNTINPGWVKTPLVTDKEELDLEEQIEMVPQKRWIEPVEVAEMVKYLASNLAGGVTGQSLNICAGLSLG